MATLRAGQYGNYYGSNMLESSVLSKDEMTTNAWYVYTYLRNNGWTMQAIAALLGNLQAESSINPGRWQSDDVGNLSGGYGLVQWTPASKYIDWCTEQGYEDYSQMDYNLSRIIYEVENGLQWITTESYMLSFKQFSESTSSVEMLAKAFLLNYERPADQSESVQNYRASLAAAWYSVLTGGDVPEPTPTGKEKQRINHYNFLLFTARRRRKTWTK